MNQTPTTKASPRASATIGAGAVLVLTMAVVIISVGFVVVGRQGWMTAASYTTAVAPAALTTTGAMIVALVLYHRWNRDHYQREQLETARLDHAQRLEADRLTRAQQLETSRQDHADKLERDRIVHSEKLEHQRAREEYFRHRAQERGKRRESMGQRMVTAVEHISSTNGMTQSAGLVELGGLVDDWWAFGQEWLNDIDDSDHESIEQINAEVLRRRQELIDLIFKQRIPSLDAEGTDAELHRWTMVQETRTRLLLNHDSNAHDSWRDLDLSHAYLKGCNLAQADLRGFILNRANLKDAVLRGGKFIGASFAHADFGGAHLERAVFSKADLSEAKFENSTFWATDFVGVNLRDAKFYNSTLWADLRGSILFRTDLREVNMQIVKLQGAKLVDNNSRFSSISTKAKLANSYSGSVSYNCETVFPKGFDPERAGFASVEDAGKHRP